MEEEIRKRENKKSLYKAIMKVSSVPWVRIICRDKKELNTVKKVVIIVFIERMRILWDQLYLVKVNNVRTNAILLPSGELKETIAAALSEDNNT